MIKLLIVDDHPLVADGIKMMLKDVSEIKIDYTALSASHTLNYLKDNTPEIILLDINLPDIDGLELCQQIRVKNTYSKIIVLTSVNEGSIITQLLHYGANGYLLKNMDRQELLAAIDTVLAGKTFLSKEANQLVIDQYTSLHKAMQQMPVLTRREKEILVLLNSGLNGPQIAQQLFLSPLTVETHRKNLMQKLNVTSLPQLLKVARSLKILE